MKPEAFLLAMVMVVAARAEQAIQVKLDWLNQAEMKCESCATQLITNKAGDWCVLGAMCGEGMVFLKVMAQWQGEAIEVSLTRQTRHDGGTFVDDGPSASVKVVGAEVKQLHLRGFKYGISASAAPGEGTNHSSEPMPTAGNSTAGQTAKPVTAQRSMSHRRRGTF